jgi:hypothetical protein
VEVEAAEVEVEAEEAGVEAVASARSLLGILFSLLFDRRALSIPQLIQKLGVIAQSRTG